MYVNAGYVGGLTFTTDFTYADTPFQTSYEPINRSSDDTWLPINEFLTSKGYAQSFSGVYAFDDAQRLAHNTDWSYTIFVANSNHDADGEFTDGGFAWAYLGGPFTVMTYDNSNWGIGRMGQVLAHETGHIFYALDEYSGGENYTAHSGYYNTQNLNAYDGNPSPSSRVNSIMGESPGQDSAYATYTSSPTSLQMIGWRDTNGNHIIDVLDEPLTLTGTSGSVDTANNQYVFAGSSSITTLANGNSRGLNDDITLNEVDHLQYSLNGGAWTNYNATEYHAFTQDFSNVRIDLPAQWSTIDFRTISDETGVTSPLFSDTNWMPSVSLGISPANGQIGEQGGVATVTATLNKTCIVDVTVNLAFSGDAVAGTDYTRSAGSIVIHSGATSGSITLHGMSNGIQAPNKTVLVDIDTVANGLENGTQEVSATIVNQDPAPTVQFTAASQSAMENAGTMTITAQLSSISGYDVIVPFSVAGTASVPGDYSIAASPITIPHGSLSATITITLVNDSVDDRNKTVVVTMLTPTRAVASGTTVDTATIIDDVPPVVAPVGNKNVDELTTLSFPVAVTDPYAPAHSESFSLDAGGTTGAGIDPTSGVFTWMPTEAQGPGTYNITVRVTELNAPQLSSTQSFQVVVNEVNLPPVLQPIGNKTVDENSTLSFTINGNDPDIPAQTLSYSASGLPSGAAFNSATRHVLLDAGLLRIGLVSRHVFGERRAAQRLGDDRHHRQRRERPAEIQRGAGPGCR